MKKLKFLQTVDKNKYPKLFEIFMRSDDAILWLKCIQLTTPSVDSQIFIWYRQMPYNCEIYNFIFPDFFYSSFVRVLMTSLELGQSRYIRTARRFSLGCQS